MSVMTQSGATLVEAAGSTATAIDQVEIKFSKFKLDNGLTVIVHENRNAPVVAVNVQYRVGAKDEPAGMTGFAHLFEHLMCGGSENLPGTYLNHFNRIGATEVNACTGFDSTNYFETVPTHALDFALFAEADRMGRLDISQETLDLQRGVVLNEKLQREGAPYGKVGNCIFESCYPQGHPYAHPVIGSVQDIEQATLDDVRSWFDQYYGPSNAVLTLAGDIDEATAREKVERYFADLPPGPPLTRPGTWIAKRSEDKREVLEDQVQMPLLQMVWNTPQAGTDDAAALFLAAMILGGGPLSRLHKRLVEQERRAAQASASIMPGLLAGQFHIALVPMGHADLRSLETAAREELARFIAEGPSQEELDRVRTALQFGEVRGLATMSAIADMLCKHEVFHGDPANYLRERQQVDSLSIEDIRAAAQRWLSEGAYVLDVLPFAARPANVAPLDRRQAPALGESPGIVLPPVQEGTLSNGIRVRVAQRNELPLVECKLLVPGGASLEPADRVGVAGLTLGLMGAGAGERDAASFAQATQRLGMGFGPGAGFDMASAHVSAFHSHLDESLDLFADAVLRPRFDEAELQRAQAMQLQGLGQELANPGAAVQRMMGSLMYGRGHVYGRSPSWSTLAAITRQDIVDCHRQLFRPEGATFLVVGATTLEEILPKLEARFGQWTSEGDRAAREIPTPQSAAPGIYVIDYPGAQQSQVTAALPAPAFDLAKEDARGALNHILGGSFSSRINMNLREEKHWTYGASGGLRDAPGLRVLHVGAPVQADRTADTIREIRGEMARIISERPTEAEELRDMQDASILSAPSITQTMGGVLGAMESIIARKLPEDHWSHHVDRIRALDTAKVDAAARELIDPDKVIWIVAGDRRAIEADLLGLNLGPITVLDVTDESMYVGTVAAAKPTA